MKKENPRQVYNITYLLNSYIENKSTNPFNNLITEPEIKFVAENLDEIQIQHPNVPVQFLVNKTVSGMKSCQTSPSHKNITYNKKNYTEFLGINFNNQYWQEHSSNNKTLYLFSAYLDNRRRQKLGSLIRIIAMIKKRGKQSLDARNYCLIWTDISKDPVISDAPLVSLKLASYHSDVKTYILTCRIPNSRGKCQGKCKAMRKVPQAVSIIDEEERKNMCPEPSNYLKVMYTHEEPKGIAVCVKGLFFLQEDLSKRFVEWIELVSTMGADKIFFYEYAVHPEIKKVLNYYEKKGIVDSTQMSLAEHQPNEVSERYNFLKHNLDMQREQSLVSLNDCLYRNIYRYKFLAYLDIDEVIVPREPGQTWIDLIGKLSKNHSTASHFEFRTTYFYEDISKYKPSLNVSANGVPNSMNMLPTLFRSKKHVKGKSFIGTKDVKKVTCHRANKCLDSRCKGKRVNVTIAHVHHYRKGKPRHFNKKEWLEFHEDVVFDSALLHFKNELLYGYNKTLSKLELPD